MPWEERSLMDVRLRFVQDVHRPGWSVAEVCRRYQVSRKTGYKWLERYGKAGPAGAVDRSPPPYKCPHAAPAAGGAQVLGLQGGRTGEGRGGEEGRSSGGPDYLKKKKQR